MDDYQTYAKIGGVKFEVVKLDKVGLFGEPIFQACTFQQVMVPQMSREVLGTYTNKADTVQRLKAAMASHVAEQSNKEV